MREMVLPTSAADINSRSVPEEPAKEATCDSDLLLRLSGRIVKGRRTSARSLAPPVGGIASHTDGSAERDYTFSEPTVTAYNWPSA